jgi:carbamoyltransferase
MNSSVLGISAFYHDSAAALLLDGEIVAAAHAERFTRIKHDASFPALAVQYVLAEAGLKVSDLSAIAFYDMLLHQKVYGAFCPPCRSG